MAEFPHLKLPVKVEGVAKPVKGGGGNKPQEQTLQNRNNRTHHGQQLATSANALLNRWYLQVQENENKGFNIPNKDDIPVFIEIDTNTFNVDSLRNWGIELISEEEGGFIIGASFDKLELFQKNVGQFIAETGRYRHSAAQIWSFASDDAWRLENIVKGSLKENWGNISDNQTYDIEITVSCPLGQMKDYPNRSEFDSEVVFQQKIDEYRQQEQQLWQDRDEKQRAREVEVEGFIAIYNGEVLDLWDNGVDAVAFKIAITGQGLKNIVFTYQYLYEAKFSSVFNVETNINSDSIETELEIIAPDENAPKVCVIDSGIQEYHQLISPAIDAASSRSYLENDVSTADHVRQSGHGTKVAGLILYPRQIPISGQYQVETFLQNARILDANGEISRRKFAPKLMETIVEDYSPTRIFNLSVCDDCSYSGSHMSPLSASIDKLTHEKDVLFVISAGNLYTAHANNLNPGIWEHLHAGRLYPNYLDEDTSKIADPGTSSFAISVGSIAHSNFEDPDHKSFTTTDFISPFSRTGLGMWKTIKPDVVEYGGDLLLNKQSADITTHDSISCEVLNSTLYGAPAVGKDAFGTSFSTPKVTSIVAKLAKEHPTESAQMYRALIIQSARLPSHCFKNPTLRDIRYYGYGLPDLDRALNNTPNRITFIQNGHVGAKKADIYTINIPEELRGEGRGFKFLIEVTLAFTSRIRQTRKGAHSYLGTWLEWRSSKYNEGFNSFRSRTIEYLDNENSKEINLEGEGAIKWCLRENPAWTENGINRNNSTVQKSWVEVEPYQLAETFNIAIVGHIGWDKNLEHEAPYALCVSFEALNPEINIYNSMAEAQIQIPVEVEEEVEL